MKSTFLVFIITTSFSPLILAGPEKPAERIPEALKWSNIMSAHSNAVPTGMQQTTERRENRARRRNESDCNCCCQ